MALRYFYKDVLPFTAMVVVECTNVGLNTLYKAASMKGMSYYVFVVYSYAFAALILLPAPFIFCRKPGLPSLNFPVTIRICILALVGFLANLVGNKGIEFSSPTLSSAMSNLTPAFTFTLAVIFRMEKLDLRSSSTLAKILGTIVSISGALVVVFYWGPTIWSAEFPRSTFSLLWPLASPKFDWLIGGVLVASQYILYSIWYVLQAQIIRIYPMEVVVTFCYCLCVAIIATPICFIAERNLDAWRLRPDIALVTILYSAFFGPFFSTVVHTWCIRLKGPLYIALFKPLSIVIAAVMGVFFLGDALHLGCVIGGVVISVGFYAVLWGKAKEGTLSGDHLSVEKAPLLQTPPENI